MHRPIIFETRILYRPGRSDLHISPIWPSLYPILCHALRVPHLNHLQTLHATLEERVRNRNQVTPPVGVMFIVPHCCIECHMMLDNADNATAKGPSSSGRVKVEPSRQTDSSITPAETCKEHFPNTHHSWLKVAAAYEPAPALRDQIALLNASRSQGACTPLCCPMSALYDTACFTASVRVKQEPFTQIKHGIGDSDPTRFRSETYDAPEAGIGHFSGSKGEVVSLRR